MPDQHRRIRSIGFQAENQPYYFDYDEGPAGDGQLRLDLMFTGLSAGTELTFMKNTNPYLHSRWDAGNGVFVPGQPSASYPVNFLGYMEVGRIIDAKAPGWAAGQVVASSFGHKTGHTADPRHDLLVPMPAGMDPMLGVFVAQMGPICANGILHADAEAFGPSAQQFGGGIAGQPVLVWGGGTVGLLTALFARAAGASQVVVVEPSAWRRGIAEAMGLTAMDEDAAWQHAKSAWHSPFGGRGAAFVFQTRARSDSLNLCLRALRPQGTVIDMAFYQGGMDGLRLGEEFHHNGLRLVCAQINRMPRALAHAWDQRRLAQQTLALLATEGDAIRRHMITHVVPYDEAASFLRHLVADRPEFMQVVFQHD